MLFITSLDPSQGTGARENQKEEEHLTRIFQIIWICNHKNKQPVEHLKNSNNNSKTVCVCVYEKESEREIVQRGWSEHENQRILIKSPICFFILFFFYSALFLCQHLTIAHLLFHLFSYRNPQKNRTKWNNNLCTQNVSKEWDG